MGRNISDAVRELCLYFPEAQAKQSHGMATFHVRGKSFANYAVNHHGDGHVALWLEANPGSQTLYTEIDNEHYFVPPYVGPKGWLGVELNRGIEWDAVIARVREAYNKVAPGALSKSVVEPIAVPAPNDPLSPEQIDPLLAERPQKMLGKIAEICLSLPETSQVKQFGNPVFKAGKKSFASVHLNDDKLTLQTWVGGEQQGFLTADNRYQIPAFMGHNGWIDLDIEQDQNWSEIKSLINSSYRHFALKRMLKQLE